MTLEWTDKRINYTSNQSREFFEIKEALGTLWIPDLWIKSLRGYSLHKHIKEQATIEIDTNNKIRFWQRSVYICITLYKKIRIHNFSTVGTSKYIFTCVLICIFSLHSVTVTVSCSMEFLWYPFDCQKCELIFQTSKTFRIKDVHCT